jgi:beta-lactamase class A
MKKFLFSFIIVPSVFACSLEGKFSQTVFDVLGKTWANEQTSYGILIADKSGDVITEDYVGADHVIYPASTIKILIAVALLKNERDLNQVITIDQVNADFECKYWDCSLYGRGKKRSIKDLLWDMITVSNNLATNQLIDVVGKVAINETAADLDVDLHVFRKVYDDVDPEPEIKERNRGTARGFIKLYLEIATGKKKYLREDLRLHLMNVLGHQKYNNYLNNKFSDEVLFYHKTGNTSKSTGDAGFFFKDDHVVILAGLQDFNRYHVCHTNGDCFYRNGSWSLSEIGQRAYQLSEGCQYPVGIAVLD